MDKQHKTFQLTLSDSQIRILIAGLNELPGKVCRPVIGSIEEQIARQARTLGVVNKHQNGL